MPQFPKMVGQSLEGETLVVPERPGADLYLVLLTFHPWDPAAAASWIAPGEELVTHFPGIRQFWLQSFPPMDPWHRWLMLRRERTASRDLAVRRVTVPIFGQSQVLRTQLFLPEPETVFVVAVSADNDVLACLAGGWSRDQVARLRLRRLRNAPKRGANLGLLGELGGLGMPAGAGAKTTQPSSRR